MSENAKWYVIHTYSGYENKVATTLQKIVEVRSLQNLICDVNVPMETVCEVKDGVTKESERKIYPSYVFVKMVLNDDTWHVIKSIRGVTGFVGPDSKAVPLSDKEVAAMGVEKKVVDIAYAVGDNVKIADGPLEGFIGIVDEIDVEKNLVKVTVSMFGRETPVELELDQVETIN